MLCPQALKKYDFARFIEPEKAYATFASLDANKDDHISFREFMQVFNTHLAVEESGLATSVAPPESGSRKAGATAVQVSKRARSLAESSRLQRVKDKVQSFDIHLRTYCRVTLPVLAFIVLRRCVFKSMKQCCLCCCILLFQLRSRISDLASADSLNNKRESQTLMEAFRKFDGDASGSIDFRELSQACCPKHIALVGWAELIFVGHANTNRVKRREWRAVFFALYSNRSTSGSI